MNKNTFTAVKLAKGEVNVYDFGTVKLHAYKTRRFHCGESRQGSHSGIALLFR